MKKLQMRYKKKFVLFSAAGKGKDSFVRHGSCGYATKHSAYSLMFVIQWNADEKEMPVYSFDGV